MRGWVKGQAGAILDGFSTSFTSPQKAVRGASFLLNLAIVSRQEPLGTELNTQIVSLLVHLLSTVPPSDEDAIHRYLEGSFPFLRKLVLTIQHLYRKTLSTAQLLEMELLG